MRNLQEKPGLALQDLVEEIFASGQMTRFQHLSLMSILLAERKITDEDRMQINRVFDHVQMGQLKLVD